MSELIHTLLDPNSLLFMIWTTLAKSACLLGVVLGLVSYTVYAERRVSSLMQDRLGPNRTGFPLSLLGFGIKDWSPILGGLGQPIADAVKLLLKEDFTPAYVKKFYYWIAPGLGISAAIIALAVIPFGSSIAGVPMVIANVDIGPLFIFAISSLGVYGIVLAGWSANSKYPFLGAIRSTSQLISYELALGLSVVPLFLIIGKLNLVEIVSYQVENGWMLLPGITAAHPHLPTSLASDLLIFPVLISFIVFTISMFAETNRLPDGAYASPYMLARSLTLFAASACGVDAIDTVYANFRDRTGFVAECEAARRDGFAGKMAIHPDQVPVINEVFTPRQKQIDEARAIVAAFEANPGAGVVAIDGQMVDRPHLRRAERLLGRVGRG